MPFIIFNAIIFMWTFFCLNFILFWEDFGSHCSTLQMILGGVKCPSIYKTVKNAKNRLLQTWPGRQFGSIWKYCWVCIEEKKWYAALFVTKYFIVEKKLSLSHSTSLFCHFYNLCVHVNFQYCFSNFNGICNPFLLVFCSLIIILNHKIILMILYRKKNVGDYALKLWACMFYDSFPFCFMPRAIAQETEMFTSL